MLKGRRIVFVLGNLELGGAERQALILARYLAEHEGAVVEVWGFNKTGPVAEICAQHGLQSRVVPFPVNGNGLEKWRALVSVARSLRQARPDILLPYTFVPNVVCGIVWQRTGAPACVWNQRDEGIVPFDSPLVRRSAQRTPWFVSNCKAGARFLVEKLGVDREKVTVIRNGLEAVGPELDRRTWRERLAVDDRCFVACMVANLHTNKDHATLLRAWRTVLSDFEPSAVLVLGGRRDGAYESLALLASKLKIADNVRFVGAVSDVAGLLNAVDVSVFSSRSEGCPNAVLESMAAGLPVAGTNIEGIREVVGAAGLRFLSPVEDADSLASVLVKLAKDPELRARAGAENRERIREQYDASRMCAETAELLKQL
ncbi:MAG TPA: glycosyltransferase family 4 protein [Pyrinomonadaceae bacterium]|nr:glycosyltransferase family 4 protein [Pyrinomonadaceae bacterium]